MPKYNVESDNTQAATPNPTLVPTDDAGTAGVDERDAFDTPWNPDGNVAIGTPPVNGTGGERGSSAFSGNELFNEDGTAKDVRPNTHYPLRGVDYWIGTQPTGNHG